MGDGVGLTSKGKVGNMFKNNSLIFIVLTGYKEPCPYGEMGEPPNCTG